ncbi:MAG: hypothetical protein LBD21_06200 [Tannerellaceae bacterium]|nr:hypothetical protein [Tannerellaceae bacterium]
MGLKDYIPTVALRNPRTVERDFALIPAKKSSSPVYVFLPQKRISSAHKRKLTVSGHNQNLPGAERFRPRKKSLTSGGERSVPADKATVPGGNQLALKAEAVGLRAKKKVARGNLFFRGIML